MIDKTKSTKKGAQRRRNTASKETARRRLPSFSLKKAAQLARKQGLANQRLKMVGSPMAVALDATLAAHVKDITKVTMHRRLHARKLGGQPGQRSQHLRQLPRVPLRVRECLRGRDLRRLRLRRRRHTLLSN